jgi:H+/Cl- antiporter ClcA
MRSRWPLHITFCLAGLLAAAGTTSPAAAEPSAPQAAKQDKWQGVDETVIERIAQEKGRPAREPYINTDQGDLLLFLFLLVGIIGGFLAGYYYRELFPPRRARGIPAASAPDPGTEARHD